MNRWRVKAALSWLPATLLLASCGIGAERAAPREPLSPLALDTHILAFGDSLTAGIGAAPGQDYPAQLAQLIDRIVIRAGISGETTQAAVKRLEPLLQAHRPDLLLLCSGANDFLRGLPAEQAERNLEQMVELAQRHRVPTVLIGVPKLDGAFLHRRGAERGAPPLAQSAPMYYRIAAKYQLWLEHSAVHAGLTKAELIDNASRHPNARGYQYFAESIAQLLVRAGALRREELRR